MGGPIPTESNINMTGAGLVGKSTSGAGKSGRMDSASVLSWLGLSASGVTDGKALIASSNSIAWSPSAAALLPDTLPAAGTLLSYGGSRQLQAGGTVSHGGDLKVGASSVEYINIGSDSNSVIKAYSNALGEHYALIGDSTGSGGPMIFRIGSGGTIEWRSTTRADAGTTDLAYGRDSAGVFGIYTDSSKATKGALTCGAITASGAVSPDASASRDLGSTSAYWRTVHLATLRSSGGVAVSVNGTGYGLLSFGSQGYLDANTMTFRSNNQASTYLTLGSSGATFTGAITASGKIVGNAAVVTAAGSAGANGPSLEMVYSGYGLGVNGNGELVSLINSTAKARIGQYVILGSDGLFGQHSVTNVGLDNSPDLTWGRDSAGVLGIYTSTAKTTKGALTCGAITASGVVDLQNSSNSTTAFRVRSAAGSVVLQIDTTNRNLVAGGDAFAVRTSTGGAYLFNNGFLAITNSTDASSATADTFLSRSSAGVWQMGTTANNALGSLLLTNLTASGAVMETPTQSTINPTTVNIPTGQRRGWYNSTLAEFRDWVNIGGTLLKSAAYT